jgi:hypothetical protein
MTALYWFLVFCLLWLVGFTLLAEAWFYEEEQE